MTGRRRLRLDGPKVAKDQFWAGRRGQFYQRWQKFARADNGRAKRDHCNKKTKEKPLVHFLIESRDGTT